ncbi:hypothetical protein BGZ94_003617 [Podila epigama]|nr:hypothetical protein BGZ94_003617 [Podila epigama]
MEQQAQRIEEYIHEAEAGKIHLTEEQIHGLETQAKFLHEHAGHEEVHGQMGLIIIISLVASQFVLLYWKKYHYRSYQGITTLGLWKPLHHLTPKLVYKWFWIVYQASYVTGIMGYMMLFLTFMGFGVPEPVEGHSPPTPPLASWGLTFLSYGIYFGILGRDFVEFCTESMAATLGYYTKEGFPRKHLRLGVCAICGIHVSNAISTIDAHGHVQPPVVIHPSANGSSVEPSIKLNCGHEFHEECIRGWCLIGKKDMCPYCKEKVDLRAFKTNPWDTTQHLYLNLLDALRYMIVWQPVIMGVVQFFFNVAGMD